MTKRIVALKSISKSYPGVTAANAVSMDFFESEIVGLVGKNGAGKSTIIRIMAGVERPDHGILAIDQSVASYLAPNEALDHGLAFVHQELNDIPMLSVAENILMGFGYPNKAGFWIDRDAMDIAARSVLAKINMDIDPRQEVASLSVAQRRMVMIARALVCDAKMIVMDEPSASLTDSEIGELHTVVRKLKSDGVCVVYVSHRLQEIMELTDRVIVMRDGGVVGNAKTGDIDQKKLIEMIVGTDLILDKKQNVEPLDPKQQYEPFLRVDHLDPFLKGRTLSLELGKGEILGLAGLAGSGRTETVKQIIGADRRSNVMCCINGANVKIESPVDALAHKIVLVPEDRRNEGALLDFSISNNISLSSLKNVRFQDRYPFPSTSAEGKLASRFFKKLFINAPSSEQKISELSGGNQQKVILARCLAADVDVLILDEPTHGIDVGAKEEIYQLIEQLADEGKSIILISSDLPELVRLASRALVLREGDYVGELEGPYLTEHNILDLCFQSDLEKV